MAARFLVFEDFRWLAAFHYSLLVLLEGTQIVSKSGVECFSFFNLSPHFREIVRKGCPHDFKGRAKLPQFIVVIIVD